MYRTGEDLRGANILFISASERKKLPMILSSLRGSSVLTVADIAEFTRSGRDDSFLNENDRVRFAINVDATSRARLKMSSKLLSLAKVVRREWQGAGQLKESCKLVGSEFTGLREQHSSRMPEGMRYFILSHAVEVRSRAGRSDRYEVGNLTQSRCKSARLMGITTRIAQCVERPHNLRRRARAWGGRFACIAALLLAAYLLVGSRHPCGPIANRISGQGRLSFNFLKFVEWPDDLPRIRTGSG